MTRYINVNVCIALAKSIGRDLKTHHCHRLQEMCDNASSTAEGMHKETEDQAKANEEERQSTVFCFNIAIYKPISI